MRGAGVFVAGLPPGNEERDVNEATPEQLLEHLRRTFPESSVRAFQRTITEHALSRAAQELRQVARHTSVTGAPLPELVQHGWRHAADHIDPSLAGGMPLPQWPQHSQGRIRDQEVK